MEHDSMARKLSVLLCGALTLALAGCQAPVEEPLLDPTVTVETTAVQAGDLSTQSTYIGTISAEGTASVGSMISGNVEQVAVAVGDTVSAGDLLCRFDDESARLSLQNAQAAANSAQESYNSAVSIYGGTDLPLLQELTRDTSQTTQLLYALRPFLKDGKQNKVERAARLARLITIGKRFLSEGGGFPV